MKKRDGKNCSGQADFIEDSNEERLSRGAPLSVRMRPKTLEDFVGQSHILAPGKLLSRAIEADRIGSLILYGPPGVGKTTLAHCVSHRTQAHFDSINAVSSNVEELRKIIVSSKHRYQLSQRKTILFIDEIHRFNKAQQDVLLPDLEKGYLVLIGATVLNPFFSLVGPLLSRSLVFELKPLSPQEIKQILARAIKNDHEGFARHNVVVLPEALDFLARSSDGDARRALNALEIGALTTPVDRSGRIVITLDVAQESIQKKQVLYDKDGDQHYDTASAFIKSMRGTDPDATLYWLAKMIYAGEDPRFIARRICICAAEDVGNADPQALVVAQAAFHVSEFIGLPEARIPLAQAAVYVASAPKSNAVYQGIEKALEIVQQEGLQSVPDHLKDASYPQARALGHGQGYQYVHDDPRHYLEQEYLSQRVSLYQPTDIGYEREIKKRLHDLRANVSPNKKDQE